jgi:hypothetical protein
MSIQTTEHDSQPLIQRLMTWPTAGHMSATKRIDILSRYAFPIAFAAFNMFYWIIFI